MSDSSPGEQIVPTEQLFKFLTADMRSPTGTGKWTEGKWRSVRGVLAPCENGLHATTAGNLIPFISDTLWRVEIGDEFVWDGKAGTSGHKIVARRMRVVERLEAWNEQTMRLFAADCAERVLHLFEERYPEDRRPRDAIEIARRYARGEATLAELNAAASASASDAAYAAAYAAAAYAASYAASYAAYARKAECEWQDRHLAEMLGLTLATEASDAAAE